MRLTECCFGAPSESTAEGRSWKFSRPPSRFYPPRSGPVDDGIQMDLTACTFYFNICTFHARYLLMHTEVFLFPRYKYLVVTTAGVTWRLKNLRTCLLVRFPRSLECFQENSGDVAVSSKKTPNNLPFRSRIYLERLRALSWTLS